jgi:hypothetical protein
MIRYYVAAGAVLVAWLLIFSLLLAYAAENWR